MTSNRIAAAALAATVLAGSARAQETGSDCPALILSAAFVAAQSHSLRVNPERAKPSSAPAIALQNANWAQKSALVFEALEHQASSRAGRAAFAGAKASLSALAAEPVEAPAHGDPRAGCAVLPNGGSRQVSKQLDRLALLERQLREAWVDSCR